MTILSENIELKRKEAYLFCCIILQNIKFQRIFIFTKYLGNTLIIFNIFNIQGFILNLSRA